MTKKIINLKKNKKGFTLIELLTSIAVIVVIGSVVAGIITSSLRGSNKANTIETIRQNGNYTLSQISKNIEYAQVFDGLRGADGIYVMSCHSAVKTSYNYIKVTTFNNDTVEYECAMPIFNVTTVSKGNTTVSDIFDNNSVTLKACSITCTQTNETDVPIIGISFTLGPINQNGLVENSTPPITFQTSVTMRNYAK